MIEINKSIEIIGQINDILLEFIDENSNEYIFWLSIGLTNILHTSQ